jgi:hypothetical protein
MPIIHDALTNVNLRLTYVVDLIRDSAQMAAICCHFPTISRPFPDHFPGEYRVNTECFPTEFHPLPRCFPGSCTTVTSRKGGTTA